MKGKTGKKMIIRRRIRPDEEVRKLNCSGTVRFMNDILKQFEENARKAGGSRILSPEGTDPSYYNSGRQRNKQAE